jgi:hypothetical protein
MSMTRLTLYPRESRENGCFPGNFLASDHVPADQNIVS